MTALVGVAALAGGLWAVGAGWDLRTIHEHAAAARDSGVPTAGVVVGRDRIAGVEVDVIEFETGRIEMPARVLAPGTERPAVGDDTRVRVVMPETAKGGQPFYAADHVRGATDDAVDAVGLRATVLLALGFTITVLAAFALASAVHFLWPDPKHRTRWHYDRYGG